MLAHDFPQQSEENLLMKTVLKNLEQIKTVPILPCKQIFPVLDIHEQIECLRERERESSSAFGSCGEENNTWERN